MPCRVHFTWFRARATKERWQYAETGRRWPSCGLPLPRHSILRSHPSCASSTISSPRWSRPRKLLPSPCRWVCVLFCRGERWRPCMSKRLQLMIVNSLSAVEVTPGRTKRSSLYLKLEFWFSLLKRRRKKRFEKCEVGWTSEVAVMKVKYSWQ